MKLLMVLLGAFGISLLLTKLFGGSFALSWAGCAAMSVMLVFTAIKHFVYTEGMTMMLPGFLPFRKEVVYLTGVLEIVAAVGLLIPGSRMITGWLLMEFFLLMLPAHLYASVKRVDYQKATFHGKGPGYLWFRIPLQLLFVVWIYLAAFR